MKPAVALTPSTASSRNSSAASSETRGGDSCYFPGCRKDANCHCEICLASIHATRDLIPSGAASIQWHRSSLTKLSVSKPRRAGLEPVPFDDAESPPPTPEAVASTVTPPSTPPIRPPVRSRPSEEIAIEKHRSWSFGGSLIGVLVCLLLLWAVDAGFSAVILKRFGPKLTAGLVSQVGEDSRVLRKDLKKRLELVQQRMDNLVGGRVSNCSSVDSNWGMNQGDQFLFQWRCVMHKSIAEKVTVWGSPLRTTGLLVTGSSPRSMTLLSGKITEWSDGKLLPTTRTSNGSSWTYDKWSSAALHLDANTWILEYERNALFQGPGLIPAAWEAAKLKLFTKAKNLKQRIRYGRLRRSHRGSRRGQQLATPT
ncbi:hypothetical protein Cni_G00266 [Canna indica]|uniref:Uncharacterized protein n=1 Tax=Canna indica TaxID=4628 RepID=A0AAQ3PW98_9LILI|nr:hypothetical protein Cni_G00266 [Canna indica]